MIKSIKKNYAFNNKIISIKIKINTETDKLYFSKNFHFFLNQNFLKTLIPTITFNSLNSNLK